MHRSTKVVLLVLAIATAGCGTSSNIQPGERPDLSGESSMLFLGVTPAYRIHLLRGDAVNGIWERPAVDIPEVNITPENGYIFVKLKPTTKARRLGVSLIFPEGQAFGPCRDSIAPTFILKAGAVTYVGDLHYEFLGGQLRYHYSVDEEKAKAFLRRYYPQSEGSMTTIPMTPMKVQSNICDPKTITIPIYVPRMR